MKLYQILNEIDKLEAISNITVKNTNEIYVLTSAKHVKDLVGSFMSKFKLYFVAELCAQSAVEPPLSFSITTILSDRKEGYFVLIRYTTSEELVSLSDIIYQSNIFEREIADLFGLTVIGGRDTRHLVKHEVWPLNVYPLRKDFKYGTKLSIENEVPDYVFKQISGEDGYQIPVGPVHAGIIEPGHFRFSVMGEPIENLEIRLMYKHRGIEKIAENIDANQVNLLFERVAGESTAAYAEAYAQLVEKLTGCTVSKEIKALRVVFLELERIYNFLDDIAGICVDVAYSYPAKKFGYFSEQIHQLCERLTGSRFLRNAISPCGSSISFGSTQKKDILDTLNKMKKRLNKIIEITLDEVSFLDRVERTGIVEKEIAKKLCMTGVVGRASGIRYDVRQSFGYELYPDIKRNINLKELGGVFERYQLKIAELRDAFDFIQAALLQINIDVPASKTAISLKENQEAIAIVETVKGELMVYGKAGSDNHFNRLYFKTPSFTNWEGLTQAVLGEIVPDFPLCNKSFNMSYSENDR